MGERAGRLRLGLPKELMESVFQRVLEDFTRDYPQVELSVRCDLSVRLTALLEAGELDLAIAKSMPGESVVEGSTGWRRQNRDTMAWLAGEGSNAMDRRPLPLAVFHEGCVFRMAAITALVACFCGQQLHRPAPCRGRRPGGHPHAP